MSDDYETVRDVLTRHTYSSSVTERASARDALDRIKQREQLLQQRVAYLEGRAARTGRDRRLDAGMRASDEMRAQSEVILNTPVRSDSPEVLALAALAKKHAELLLLAADLGDALREMVIVSECISTGTEPEMMERLNAELRRRSRLRDEVLACLDAFGRGQP